MAWLTLRKNATLCPESLSLEDLTQHLNCFIASPQLKSKQSLARKENWQLKMVVFNQRSKSDFCGLIITITTCNCSGKEETQRTLKPPTAEFGSVFLWLWTLSNPACLRQSKGSLSTWACRLHNWPWWILVVSVTTWLSSALAIPCWNIGAAGRTRWHHNGQHELLPIFPACLLEKHVY